MTESDVSLQEDPAEDMKYLDLTHDDTMFVITSAGDNALHYAIAAQPKRVCSIDCKIIHRLTNNFA